MKIRISDLKRLIESIARDADTKLCLNTVLLYGNTYDLVVYDPDGIEELLKKPDATINVAQFQKRVVGMIRVGPTYGRNKAKLPCNNALQVKMVAGDGKLMYGLGYEITGRLISDRTYVSKTARSGWKKQYSSGRGKYPLDDYENPQTPDPNDDCEVYKNDPDAAVLNNAYEKNNDYATLAAVMTANNERIVSLATSLTKFSEDNIKAMIVRAGSNYFNTFDILSERCRH
jgi:hypothetical protein